MTRPRKNLGASGIRTRDLPLSRRTPQPLGQRGGPQSEADSESKPNSGTIMTSKSAILVLCRLLLLVGCLASQQRSSVSQERISPHDCTCCHTEIEVADQTFHLTQSQYTDTGPTNPSTDPKVPVACQGSHWSANFEVTGMTRPRKNLGASGNRTQVCCSRSARFNH